MSLPDRCHWIRLNRNNKITFGTFIVTEDTRLSKVLYISLSSTRKRPQPGSVVVEHSSGMQAVDGSIPTASNKRH